MMVFLYITILFKMKHLSKKISHYGVLFLCIALIYADYSCVNPSEQQALNNASEQTDYNDTTSLKIDTIISVVNDTSEMEYLFLKYSFVDISSLDSSIIIDLKYSTTDNFVGIDLYGNLEKAYLHPDAAEKLLRAQVLLKEKNPYYNLVVFDAARPNEIQKLMWDSVHLEASVKRKYLTPPELGSMHNYGLAVDLSISDSTGTHLDMGTPFDSFEKLAQPAYEKQYLREGKLTAEQVENRKLLRSVMEKSGFKGITTEWWHFSIAGRQEAMQNYKLVTGVKKVEGIMPLKKETYFAIQILATNKKHHCKDKIFKGLDIYRIRSDNVYKYITGEFGSQEEARARRDEISKDFGFEDAFMIEINPSND